MLPTCSGLSLSRRARRLFVPQSKISRSFLPRFTQLTMMSQSSPRLLTEYWRIWDWHQEIRFDEDVVYMRCSKRRRAVVVAIDSPRGRVAELGALATSHDMNVRLLNPRFPRMLQAMPRWRWMASRTSLL